MQDFADSDIWELMPLDVSAKASGQQAPLETPNVSSDVFELGALEHEELGFVEGIKDVFGAKLLPFVGAAVEAKHLANLHSAVKRVEEGTQSEEDEQLLVEFLRLQQRAGRGGVGYKVATILAELPAFVAEFAAGGAAVAKAGAKVAAAKAVKEAVEKAARKSAQMAVAKWGVSKGVARAGAGIAKTSLMAGAQLGAITAMGEATGLAMAPFQGYSGGSRISANAWRRALPDMALSGDESTQLTLHFYNTADEFLDALPTAVADEYIEILSERSGAGIRSAFQKLPGADQVAVMQASVARWWTQKYGEGAAAKLMKRIAKAGGWDGVLEEFAEERLGGFLRGATGVEEGGILANTFPDLEQMAAELIAFSVPGAASSALRAFTDQRTSPMLGTGLEGVMPTGADAARVAGQGRLTEEDYGAIQGDLLDRGIDVVEPTTPEQRRVVEKGNRLGIDVILVQGQDGKALPVQALTPREGVVLVDVNAEAGLDYNFSHEWIHDLEKKHKPLHDALVNRVQQLDPEGYARWLEDYKERYRQQFGRELPETAEDTEGLAGYHDAHKALMFFAETEEGQRALSQLLQNDRTLAQEMLDWLKETVNKLTGWKLKTTMEKRLDMIAQQLGKEQVTLSEASIAFTFGQVIRELYGRFESPISRRAAALPEAARPRLGQGGRVQVYEPPVEPRQAPREVDIEPEPQPGGRPQLGARPEPEPQAEPEPEPQPEPQPERQPEPEPEPEPQAKPKPIPRRAPAEEEAPKAKPQVEAPEPDIAKARRNRLYSNLNQTIERFDRAELGDDEAQEAEALVERARSIRDQVAAPGAVENFASVEAEGRQIITRLRELYGGAKAQPAAPAEKVAEQPKPASQEEAPEPAIPEEPPVVPERPGAQIGWDTTSERAERWSNYYADEFHFKGNRSKVQLPDGRTLPVTYMLVDVTDLLPTHDEQTFQPNPGADINERQYQDAKLASASREMVQRIAENPDPKQLYSNSVTAVEGPPGGKNADVLGKAAFFAAEEFGIYEQMDMDRGDFYRGWRTEYNLPVIVRVIDESHMGNPGELSRVLNDQHTAERSLGSDAVGRAARLDGDAATLLGVLFSGGKEGGKRTFADIVNDARLTAELVNILVKAGAWTAQDTGRSVDAATGKLNQGGREVIQRTLLAAAVDNVQDAAAVFKLAPAQLNKLMASVPSLIRARSYDARVAQVFGDVVDGLVALNSYPGTLQELVAQQEIGDPATWKQNTLAHRFIETFLGLKQREWVKRMSQLALDLQDYASGQTSLFGGGAQMTFERAMLNAVQNEADSNPSGKQGVRDQENREQRETQQRNNEDYMPPRGKRKKGEEPLYSLPRPDNYADAAGDYRQFLDEQGVSPANTSEIVRQLRDRHVAQAGDDFDAEDAAFADLENPESQYRQFERQFLLDIADGRIGWGIGWVDRGQEGSVDPEEADPTNDYQVVYEPASQMRSLGTVVPKNMRSAMKRALRDFQKQNGSVDEYVARELGWTAEQTADRLGAEQVDAVALGISQLKQGKGFILGAQTGVGKGRVVGALELWAIRNNLLPIFVTEGHGLFQAAWRDRSSIGSEGQVRPYALSWQASPVQVSPGFTWHPNERHGPNAMSTEKAIKSRRKMIKYAQINGRLPESGPNAIWATYTDFNQKGKRDNPMTHPLVRALAPNAVFILDESHNMIGQETKQGDRADVMQDMVAKSKGAVYSSATFAKTPYALRMFMKTDLGIVGANGVATTVKQGGRALEQHVNLMLANAGQLVRYERSYTGIQFNDRVVPAKDEQGVSRMDAVAKLVRRIRTIDVEALKAARQTKQAEVRAEMEPDLQPGDQSRYRYNSQSYVNIIHDVTRAALMAVKADDVVEVAVEEVAKGRKPVIFADMTGESGVQRWLEKNPDNEVGSEIKASDISFAEYLDYAIDRLRTISVSDPELETNVKTIERHVITDDELRAYGLDWAVDEIQDIMKQARETLSALPGSPYDYVYDRLTQAGVKVGELSGRSVRVAYKGDPRQDDTVAVIESRQMSAADRNKVRDEFNNGLRDVLLYNSSAATGVDMHAGETFADQRQRVFLGWQAAQDVTVQVQAFGRINRTGQMTQPNDNARLFPKAQYGLPEYYMVYADVPVEQKVRAILSATMQQLGALTTGSSRSATNLEAVDPIMNKYGDAAAAEALQQIDPGILEAIDMEPKLSPGLARRMANRSLALTVAQQQELFDLLDSNYQAIVEQLNAEGRNDIESEVLDVDAVTVRAFVHQHATGRSPFQQPIVEERIDMKLDQLPLTSQQMQARRAADFDAKVAQLYDTIGVAGNQYAQLMEQRESDLAAKIAEVDRARNGLSGRVMSGEITPSRAEALRVTLDAEIRSLNAQAAGARASARDKRNKVDQMFSVLAQVQLSSKAATKYVAQFAGGSRKDFYGYITDISGPNTDDPAKLLQPGRYYIEYYSHESPDPMRLPFNLMWQGMPVTEKLLPAQLSDIDSRSEQIRKTGRIQKSFLTGNLLQAYAQYSDLGRAVLVRDEFGRHRSGILLHDIRDLDTQTGKYPVMAPAATVEQLLEIAQRARQNQQFLEPHDAYVKYPNAHLRFLIDFSADTNDPGYLSLELQMSSIEDSPDEIQVEVMGRKHALGQALKAMPGVSDARVQKWWIDPYSWGGPKANGLRATLTRAQINTLLEKIPGERRAQVYYVGSRKDRLANHLRPKTTGIGKMYFAKPLDIPFEDLGAAIGQQLDGPQEVMDLNWLDEALYSLRRSGKGRARRKDQRIALSFDVGTETWLDRMRRRFQDRDIRWKRLEEAVRQAEGTLTDAESVYLAQELYPGRTEARVEDWNERHYVKIVDWMHKHNISLNDADLYLYARHAEERNEYIKNKRLKEWRTNELRRIRREAQSEATRAQASLDKELAKEKPSRQKVAALQEKLADALRLAANPYAALTDPPADTPFLSEDEPGSGMRTKDARKLLAEYEKENDEGYRGLGKLVDAMNRETRDRQVRAGLTSQETADEWEEQFRFYVPLRTNVEPGRETVGKRFDTGQTESREAWGRRSLAFSPLSYSIQQGRKSVIRAEKNRIGQTLLRLIDSNKELLSNTMTVREEANVAQQEDGEFMLPQISEPKEGEFSTKVQGKIKYIRISDPLLLKSINGMSMQHPHNAVRLMAAVVRMLSRINTSLDPEFMLRNFVRDLQTAGLNLAGSESSKMAAQVVKDTLSGKPFKAIVAFMRGKYDPANEWHRAYNELRSAGGLAGWFYMPNIDQTADSIHKDLQRNRAASGLRAFGKFIEDSSRGVENGVRLAAYYRARRAGATVKQAASLAKNLTVNFNRQGEWGQVLNSFYMFYNASIQGTRTMLSVMRNRKAQRFALGIVASSMILDAVNAAISDDDEFGVPYYDKIPLYERERNLILMLEGDDYMKIPLPYGYNLFHAIGQVVGLLNRDVISAPEALSHVAGTAYGAFFPFGSEATLLQAISPTLLDPVVQIHENKTFYGAPLRPPQYGSAQKPAHQQYWQSVSPVSKKLTSWLNTLGGGDEVTPSPIWGMDVSPESLDHVMGFVTGGAGRTAGRLVRALFDRENTTVRDIPFARTVMGEADRRYDQAKYYKLRDEVTYAKRRYEAAIAEKDLERIAELRREDAVLLRMVRPLRAAETRLRKLRDFEDRAQTPQQKEQVKQAMQNIQSALIAYLYRSKQ